MSEILVLVYARVLVPAFGSYSTHDGSSSPNRKSSKRSSVGRTSTRFWFQPVLLQSRFHQALVNLLPRTLEPLVT